MKGLKIFTILLILGALACGLYTMPLGQGTDTAIASGSASNQAVFISKTGDPTAATVAEADIERGCVALGGEATFDVDASSDYSLSVNVQNFATTGDAVTVANSADEEDAVHLDGNDADTQCDTPLTAYGDDGKESPLDCTDMVADGDGLSCGAVTSGYEGYDFGVNAAIYFVAGPTTDVNDAYFSDAPNGTYTFDIVATVSDA